MENTRVLRKGKQIMKFYYFLLLPVFFLVTCSNKQSIQQTKTQLPVDKVDSTILLKLQAHVHVLCTTSKPRNHKNINILDSVALYIYNQLLEYADTVYYQEFTVEGLLYRNVIAVLNPSREERIVIGAHYDICENSPGADDNASGIAGLIEIGRLISSKKLNKRIDLVAFTLEEPPYFRTEDMGSYKYASFLKKNKIDVEYMVSLEMIGYFTEEENSQEYPLDALKVKFGTKGNFLTIVENENQRGVGNAFYNKLNKNGNVKYQYLEAPSFLTGVDFSDHLSFWKNKIKAFMITDTAFYRNQNYHKSSDKPETLNFTKIAYFVKDFADTF